MDQLRKTGTDELLKKELAKGKLMIGESAGAIICAPTPYWRTLKANGELNEKYPNGIEAQKEKLEAEGHTIVQKGRKNIADL